jgi:hypothetical protein
VGGVLRGEQPALRRVLGARKGGRYGAAMAAAGLVAGVPVSAIPGVVLLGLAAAAVGALAGRGAHGMTLYEYLRLSLWAVAPLLWLAAPLRLLEPDTLAPGIFAVAVGHALLWRGVRRGLG